ncbi:MAG: glutathione peroxidase [Methylococcaceae bacterium]|nr:glutathione peroxidase [Methylococcaceae bacterium]
MIHRLILPLLLILFSAPLYAESCPEYLNHPIKKLHSTQSLNICETYPGKTLLIVNTASHCGYTPQFKELEQLHRRYKDKGLVVLGFSSNDFKQEAKNDQEIANVCFLNYGVTFDMFAPIAVTGEAAHPLFKALAAQTSPPAWNFNKYLVNSEGKVVNYFDSEVTPDSSAMIKAIEQTLRH